MKIILCLSILDRYKYFLTMKAPSHHQPQKGAPNVHGQIFSMSVRKGLPSKGKIAPENLMPNVEQDGIRTRIDKRGAIPVFHQVYCDIED